MPQKIAQVTAACKHSAKAWRATAVLFLQFSIHFQLMKQAHPERLAYYPFDESSYVILCFLIGQKQMREHKYVLSWRAPRSNSRWIDSDSITKHNTTPHFVSLYMLFFFLEVGGPHPAGPPLAARPWRRRRRPRASSTKKY